MSVVSQTLPNLADLSVSERRDAVRLLVDFNKAGLSMALRKCFGSNLQAKVDFLKALKARLKYSYSLSAVQKVAVAELLSELNGKLNKKVMENVNI